jgi:hypothetical protein
LLLYSEAALTRRLNDAVGEVAGRSGPGGTIPGILYAKDASQNQWRAKPYETLISRRLLKPDFQPFSMSAPDADCGPENGGF